MEDIVVTGALVVGLLALTSLVMMVNNHKNKKIFHQRMLRLWGQIPELELSEDQLQRVSLYAETRKDESEFYVDDITWSDLDMDRIFQRMNNTVSAPGQEYLYYLLRTPQLTEEPLKEREKYIRYFSGDKQARIQVQSYLSEIGKLRATSVTEAMKNLTEAPYLNGVKHIALALAFFGSMVLFVFNQIWGIVAFLLMVIINAALYYCDGDKKTVELYLGCFQCILRMLDFSKKAKKLDTPAIVKTQDKLYEIWKEMKHFRKGSFFLSGKKSTADGLDVILLDFLRTVTHIDLIKYNRMLREVAAHKEDIEDLIENIGFLDSALAIASYREQLPSYCQPKFIQEKETASLKIETLYHPLISNPVPNDFTDHGGVLLTGSNASGKSTFLKNIAVNAILAQTIYISTSSCYEASMFRVMTSMALRDNLGQGDSYFIVEIKSLKRILDATKITQPLLCVIDEVLRGTNTIERIAASGRILRELIANHVICLAATHDIELSYILEDIFTNYHFEERIHDHDVTFDYALKFGRATSRNAIALLEMLGYDEKIVKDAKESIARFEETGVWN